MTSSVQQSRGREAYEREVLKRIADSKTDKPSVLSDDEVSNPDDRVLKEYFYGETLVARRVSYSPGIGARKVEELEVVIDSEELAALMSVRDRIHWSAQNLGVRVALGFNRKDRGYSNFDAPVTDDELGIYVMDIGAKSLTDLSRKDKVAHGLVKARGLQYVFDDKNELEEEK